MVTGAVVARLAASTMASDNAGRSEVCYQLKSSDVVAQLSITLSLLVSAGQPHVAVGTSNVPLVLGLAAALLIAGKPVHLAHKEARGAAC